MKKELKEKIAKITGDSDFGKDRNYLIVPVNEEQLDKLEQLGARGLEFSDSYIDYSYYCSYSQKNKGWEMMEVCHSLNRVELYPISRTEVLEYINGYSSLFIY